jgi:RNA polymerase sigma factor (sigma-70 family)
LPSKSAIEQCRAGSRLAQRDLYYESFNLLMHIGKRYATNEEDAKDIVNRSFYKILDKIAELRDHQAYFVWAKQIAIRTAIDFVRGNKRYHNNEKQVIDMRQYDIVEANTNAIDDKFAAQTILDHIADLPQMVRQVVNLFIIDDYSHKEIATMLNISTEASRRHLMNGRIILKQKLEELYSGKSAKIK